MVSSRMAWLGLVAAVGLSFPIAQGCTGGTSGDESGAGVCGNGRVEGTEACDDGNADNTDACANNCTLPTCGDGVVQTVVGEQCDDGNDEAGDGCDNCMNESSSTDCGNGVIDPPDEQCDDDGQNTANCDADCTLPECGDGIVNQAAGETCEPSELGDCPECGQGGGSGQGGCENQQVYAGIVTNNVNPLMAGSGISSQWSYSGMEGIQAGQDMCAAIGGDKICSYQQVLDAEAAGELSGLAEGQEFWIHRVATTVNCLDATCNMSSGVSVPGPGGRCNDWTYSTNHISDGEFAVVDSVNAAPANATKIGNVIYYMDDNTFYNPGGGGGTPGGECSTENKATGHNDGGIPGCAGKCGGATPRAILCCYESCR